MTQNFLAIDLGAETGRGVLASFDGTRVVLRELRRFPTARGEADMGADGVRRWDFERLWAETEATYRQARREAGTLAGVGVDGWGVDFGLLDGAGRLLEVPIQYRDVSHSMAMREALDMVPEEELWDRTGIQTLPISSLFQLLARQRRDPNLLEHAHRMLMIPDLIHCRLTGGASGTVEMTNATTTQCVDAGTRIWDTDLLARCGLPSHFLGPMIPPGGRIGTTPDGTPVYAGGTHDTASAVAAVPADEQTRWAFLSSGTWSLLGAERAAPTVTPDAREAGFSNEGGVGGTTCFLQNIMGLWLVQECRRSLPRGDGREHRYDELTALAAAAPAHGPLFTATSQRFLAPMDMLGEIQKACCETGQAPPVEVGPIIRCCLESLALAYRRGLSDMGHILGETFDVLHVVGGGAKNRLLNQFTADACGLPVVAGPVEAAALGNVLGQMVGSGAVRTWDEARDLSRRSSLTETFYPDAGAAARWQQRCEAVS